MKKLLLSALLAGSCCIYAAPAKKAAPGPEKKTVKQPVKKAVQKPVKKAVQKPAAKPQLKSDIYTKGKLITHAVFFDRFLFENWKKNKLPIPQEASDSVLVRRLYLDLLGRLPTVEEAQDYVKSTDKHKYSTLTYKLTRDERFAAYWTMRWSDVLRVKSEFPINLWPNAVYGYQRRINRFLYRNERLDGFLYSLLLAEGSNFRVPEVNFYRATADRTPAGIAKAVLLTVWGERFEKLPESEQKNLSAFFEEVAFKSTREWKEEIVYRKMMPDRTLILPDGTKKVVKSGVDGRKVFADYAIYGKGRKKMAAAVVNRVWYWFFGQGLMPSADDLRNAKPENKKLFDALVNDFLRNRCDFRRLCLFIVRSAAYRSASVPFAGNNAAMNRTFAAYPVRRLEAEVLDDAIRDVTGTGGNYASVIPEPFTFLPPGMRTVDIADGSISSSFLILFGRPARDAGTLDERSDKVTPKQRMFLFNSGLLFSKLNRIAYNGEMLKLNPEQKIERFFWLFYSRPPTAAEKTLLLSRYKKINRHWHKQRRFWQDLGWILVNSAEFLHRH